MQGLCFNCLLPGVIFWYFFWRHSKSDIWWRQSVAVTIKPILESIWIVKPYQIDILIKFSFIYYFFNRAKLKTHNCKQRQFYHPLCTWVHNPLEQLFKNKCPGGGLFFFGTPRQSWSVTQTINIHNLLYLYRTFALYVCWRTEVCAKQRVYYLQHDNKKITNAKVCTCNVIF